MESVDILTINCFGCNVDKYINLFRINKTGNINKKCIKCESKYNCEHDKYKYTCKECKGSNICEHNKQKRQCKECKGNAICEHNKYKYTCKECNFDSFLKNRVINRMYSVLSTQKPSLEYLGCTISEYKLYIENKLLPEWNWDNYGKEWSIDHIKPLKVKDINEEEIIERLHYTNTQPLDFIENIRKGNRE